MSNQEKYNSLRQTYPEFVYESYKYNVQPDGLHIMFSFRIGEHLFQPQSFIPARPFLSFDQTKETLDLLVFNIGMIELISYWKCACPPTVRVLCGTLDDSQVAFWRKLYWHGLGEFFYVNGIQETPTGFLNLQSSTGFAHSSPKLGEVPQRGGGVCPPQSSTGFAHSSPKLGEVPKGRRSVSYLVPIGGGKDSVVSLELLRGAPGVKVVPLIMNPRGATVGCIEAAGYTVDDVLVIRRTIDPHLLELNAQGFLNGHTPFSAMLAFYTLLAAQLSGIPNIALSNESSANESTVLGSDVNHQYSKSLDFENDFRAYVSGLSTLNSKLSTLNYFSLLRPLSELQIAMLFSRHEKYFDVFRSCNVGSKQDIWCGHCAKCLFAYIILSPFIPPARLSAIFGKNMLDDPAMQTEFDQLTGHAATKPFECVGTVSEVNSALSMTLARWYDGTERPCLLADYRPQPPVTPLGTLAAQHNLSPFELSLIEKELRIKN